MLGAGGVLQRWAPPRHRSPVATRVTLDANWRWVHARGDTTNCYDGNIWDSSFCPDPATCNSNCEMGEKGP